MFKPIIKVNIAQKIPMIKVNIAQKIHQEIGTVILPGYLIHHFIKKTLKNNNEHD